ncbi:MAG: 4-hydroxythreonine-4-phosphate dehydrogenase PdxA, partial [Planctomycetota bacterium]
MNKPTIAISMGDPGGIGPEVIVKALADGELRRSARWRIFGAADALSDAAVQAGIDPMWWSVAAGSPVAASAGAHDVVVLDDPTDAVRQASRSGGAASFRWVESAIAATKLPAGDPLRADAIVTGPISKEAWSLAGRAKYPGHSELLATRFNAKRWAMMFVGPRLKVVLATVHVPLFEVRDRLTIGRVFDAIELGHEACVDLGIRSPRIAVCGLNPHAGESG